MTVQAARYQYTNHTTPNAIRYHRLNQNTAVVCSAPRPSGITAQASRDQALQFVAEATGKDPETCSAILRTVRRGSWWCSGCVG